MGKEFLVVGAQIKCPLGTKQIQQLAIPEDCGTYVKGKLVARAIDCQPVKNIPPFGICSVTQKPCAASYLFNSWINTETTTFIGLDIEAPTTESMLFCLTGQTTLSPVDSAQDPLAAGVILLAVFMQLLQTLDQLARNAQALSSFVLGIIVAAVGAFGEGVFSFFEIPNELTKCLTMQDKTFLDDWMNHYGDNIAAGIGPIAPNSSAFNCGRMLADVVIMIGATVGGALGTIALLSSGAATAVTSAGTLSVVGGAIALAGVGVASAAIGGIEAAAADFKDAFEDFQEGENKDTTANEITPEGENKDAAANKTTPEGENKEKLKIDGKDIKKAEGAIEEAAKEKKTVKPGSFFEDHLKNPHGMNARGDQISGGHNGTEFSKELGTRKGEITSAKPSKTHPGITEVGYTVENDKGVRVSGTKTVYDPNVYSDDQMKDWALEAAQNASDATEGGLSPNDRWTGTASNGMTFTGFTDKDGNIKTGYPIIGKQKK